MISVSRRHAAVFFVFLLTLTSVFLGQGRGPAAPRGQAPAPQRGQDPSAPRGQAPPAPRGQPPGQRGPAQRGQRGQPDERKDKNEELVPNDGLVLAYVTVTGKDHRSFGGLTRFNFRVSEDNVEQSIEYFSVESSPITIGFVLGGPPNESREVPLAFLKTTPWNDEYFILIDERRPPGGTVIQSFTTDIQKATHTFLRGGVSPDAIDVGLDYLKEAGNRRKLLLLIGGTLSTESPTGGLDPDRVIRQATRQDVQVYSILTSNEGEDTLDDGGTSDISPLTGGRNYVAPPNAFALEGTAEEIARGLTVQYEIGYRSTNPAPDGKWRKIRVDLVNVPESAEKLDVWTKSGYYVDKQKKAK